MECANEIEPKRRDHEQEQKDIFIIVIQSKKLKEIQQRFDETKPALKLIQESKTRWNSTYQMIKQIAVLKESILLFDQEWDIDWNMNWKLIPKIIDGLKPFDDLTNVFNDRQATIADAIPQINWLRFLISHSLGSKLNLKKLVNDIAAKNLTDQLTTPPRMKQIITPCSSKDWTQFVQGSSDDEEDPCEKMNNKILSIDEGGGPKAQAPACSPQALENLLGLSSKYYQFSTYHRPME
uniref:Uncharacterized protein n=1 Tax=Romanomermis culicivorax TaxID=13658 RepID=A0A915KEH2_ROMCU